MKYIVIILTMLLIMLTVETMEALGQNTTSNIQAILTK